MNEERFIPNKPNVATPEEKRNVDAARARFSVSDSEMLEKMVKDMKHINLPDNPETIERLKNKLEDYKQRSSKDAEYKAIVVEKLLADGKIDTEELCVELWDKDNKLDVYYFTNACAVIADYCETGGKETRGGTGF